MSQENKEILIAFRRVHYIPRELEPGILYVSEEFEVAAHLCPCKCGNKIITPLGPTDWHFTETMGMPSLNPSIGNWQLPCRSHYWIRNGKIEWSYQWSDEQIADGRKAEEKRRRKYYNQRNRKHRIRTILAPLVNWLRGKGV